MLVYPFKRRVLGDISNRHVNRHENAGGSEGGAAKKKSAGLGKVGLQVKTPSGKQRTREATPVKAMPAVSSRTDDVEVGFHETDSCLPP